MGSKFTWISGPRAKEKRLKNAWMGFKKFAGAFWRFEEDFRTVRGGGTFFSRPRDSGPLRKVCTVGKEVNVRK